MQEYELWLKMGKEGLMAAKELLRLEILSTSIYHCHQTAEKTLKGYLAFKKHEIIKTCNLVKLVELCCEFDNNFEELYDLAEQLNPFATKFRYPTEFDIPDFADTEAAIKQTQKIMNFVIKKIAEPETGQIKIFN